MGTKKTSQQTTKATKTTKNVKKVTRKKPANHTSESQPSPIHRHHRLRKWLAWIGGGIIALVLAVYIAFQVSPWPETLIIRYYFDKGGEKTSAIMEKYVPSGIASTTNLQYHPHDKDAKLDVFYPESVKNTDKALPTIVWIHGGAWVSGNKENISNYIKILAAEGYTTVGIDYTVAPNAKYPTPILQTNDALRYLQENAKRLHIDPNNIVLAGDSAGSQIAAQVATIISNPSYAREINMEAPIKKDQLKAVVLNCGAYDLTLPNYNGEDGKFLKTVLWAYSGTKDFLSDPKIKTASVVDYVNDDFPPSFITAGNADPLESQSREFAQVLAKLGVHVDTLFYPEGHEPRLPHEYQFDLDTTDAKNALNRVTEFLHTNLK